MENHPIPQDITGFQFKLIGNMTVKQFVYLAVGAILAWFFFFILPLPGIIKWPLSFLSFGLGAAIAFVPIDGRPMDVMIINFVKALFAPTQFIYQKTGGKLPEQPSAQATVISVPPPAPVPGPELVEFPKTPASQGANPSSVIHLASPTPQSVNPSASVDPTAIPASMIADLNKPKEEPDDSKTQEAKEEKEKLQDEVEELKKELGHKQESRMAPTEPPAPQPSQTPDQTALEKQLIEATRQKEELEKQLLALKAKLEGPKQTFNPTVAKAPAPTQRVRRIPFGMEKTVGLTSAPDVPNLITGIVKDPRGNPLPNILVEVKDADSNPVRAFKTNGLGKFASATSLSNGKYIITFEDSGEQHKFDAVEIELAGAPVMPLEIISVDPREELRRELFN